VLLICASRFLCKGNFKAMCEKQQSSASVILGENTSQHCLVSKLG
jgi:hypothetical protein